MGSFTYCGDFLGISLNIGLEKQGNGMYGCSTMGYEWLGILMAYE